MKMAVTVYILYVFINTGIALSLSKLSLISSLDFDAFSMDAFLTQTCSVIATLVVAQILKKNKLGFTYIPVEKIRIKYSLINKAILFVGIILVAILSTLLYLGLMENQHQLWLLMVTVALFSIGSLAVLFYISIKKEYE
jgi:hypothetical protein